MRQTGSRRKQGFALKDKFFRFGKVWKGSDRGGDEPEIKLTNQRKRGGAPRVPLTRQPVRTLEKWAILFEKPVRKGVSKRQASRQKSPFDPAGPGKALVFQNGQDL